MAKLTLVFSPSSLDTFDTCDAKYNYSYNLRKELPLIHKTKSLDYGTLGHAGMETYYNGLAEGKHFNDRVHESLISVKSLACDPDLSNSEPEDLSIIINALEQNFSFWRHEDDFIEILAVEAPFDYVLYEDDLVRIILSGKIDLLINKPAIGNSSGYTNLPYDHKFYARDFPVFRLSNQFIAYSLVMESNFLIVNRVGIQKTLKPEEKFKRLPLSFDDLYKEQWKKRVVYKILNSYLNNVANDYWPENPTSCTKFNKICEFARVCDSSGDSAKLFTLENQYDDKKEWNKYSDSDGELTK